LLPPIYSRRKRQAEATGQDVYDYVSIPSRVRVQIIQMLESGLGLVFRQSLQGPVGNPSYERIVRSMRLELGVHRLAGEEYDGFQQELFFWLQQELNIDYWLDGVELSLRIIEKQSPDKQFRSLYRPTATPNGLIAEFNARLLEAAVGYQYVSGEIIRIDSQHIHSEVVLPVLHLLSDPRFKSANKEYRSAHEAYRHGDLEHCLVDCGKALESVLKVVGRKREWKIDDNDTANKLIQAAANAGFLATYSEASLNHLIGLMKSSTPTIRNKMAGHGAGASPRIIPQHLAAFQLHQTAAVILYLVEQDAALP
jgi:hypothetical protein